MSETEFPYPMWVVECDHDGFVCTVWEKPGTGCDYIQQCPKCGVQPALTTRVESREEHNRVIERANAEAHTA